MKKKKGLSVYNLGTGNGQSVLQMVKAFEKASGQKIPYEVKARRAGDIAEFYCSPEKAKIELDWEAKRDINDMCKDSWNWQSQNPSGYNND